MARPRGFAPHDAVRAARELFWERGYETTSLTDIEERTGLNRSSLYQAFGNKRGLFDEALRSYLAEVAEPTIVALLRPDAGLADVVAYLRTLADGLRAHPELGARGCLIVNTVVELAGRDTAAHERGLAYRNRLESAFGTALRRAGARGETSPERAPARAKALVATVIGILLTARLDPIDAADRALAAADEVTTWRLVPPPP